MKTFEVRGKIEDVKCARESAEKMDAISKGFYSRTDFIFKIKDVNDVLRLTIYEINNRQSKNYIFTHKTTEWFGNVKTDKIILENKFDTNEEVTNFMKDHYGDFEEIIKYSRIGWEYELNEKNIFIENIEKLGPVIEIESDNKDDLENLLKIFDVSDIFSEPTSEIMRKLLEGSNG